MKQNIYVMIDCVSGNHGDLFMMPNDASVIRSLSGVMDKMKSSDEFIYNMYRDTHVYCIGTFDSSQCPMIEACSPSRFVVAGASFISHDVSDVQDSAHEEEVGVI